MKAASAAAADSDNEQNDTSGPTEDTTKCLLECNQDLINSYDVLKVIPMGHKGKFYKRILSRTDSGSATEAALSQSLPSSLDDENDQLNGNLSKLDEMTETRTLLVEQQDTVPAKNGVNLNQDQLWFNTWPERCDKIKPSESPKHKSPTNTQRLISDSNSGIPQVKRITLNEALQNISLAYSPVTKQLHLVQTPSSVVLQSEENETSENKCQEESTQNTQPRKTHRRIEAGSFSSTISSISDVSPSGSLLDTDDNVSECSDSFQPRKRGISQFFNRNVFSWKTNTNNSSSSTTGVWKLFHKASGGDVTTTQESPKHEAIVASSSALIQLKRPSNLPAKTDEEEQKHRDEYEAIIAAAKRKEAANCAAKQKQQKLQLQLEEQQAASTKHFVNTVLPNWEQTHRSRKTRDLWWQGLPSSVRGRVWRRSIGNDLNLTRQLYDICLARAQTQSKQISTSNSTTTRCSSDSSSKVTDSGSNGTNSNTNITNNTSSYNNGICGMQVVLSTPYATSTTSTTSTTNGTGSSNGTINMMESEEDPHRSSLDAIQLDIDRIFPNLGIFQHGGPYSATLHSLLAAYVCYRPDVGYVQGMAYLAAILLLNLDQYSAFVCFANLLNRPLHLAAFSSPVTDHSDPHNTLSSHHPPNHPSTLSSHQHHQHRHHHVTMSAYYSAYHECLQHTLPRLAAHFDRAGLTADLYLLDWVYTVYARAMPLDVASRVWDVYVRDGDEFLFRTALGILHLHQDILLTMDFLHGSQFLTRLPEDLSADLLFKSIQTVNTKIGKQSFAQIVERCSASESSAV